MAQSIIKRNRILLRDTMDIEWLIHHLCFDENFEQADIDIDLHDSDEWARLVASLARSRSIRILKLSRTPDYEMRSIADLESLFAAVSMIPSLEVMELDEFCTLAFESARQALIGHGTIQKLEISISGREPISIESVRALASMSQLRCLVITLSSSWPLSYLCDSQSLEEITAAVYPSANFDDNHIVPFMRNLQTTATLHTLDVHNLKIHNAQVQLLATMLRRNTSLEHLSFTIFIDEEVNESCQAIIDALHSNESLRTFHNYELSKVHVTSETQAKQTITLYKNTTLTRFSLFEDSDPAALSSKQMYLKLNTAGRKSMLQTAMGSREAWVEALIQLNDDITCLHQVIRMNPSLCIQNHDYTRPAKRPCRREPTEAT